MIGMSLGGYTASLWASVGEVDFAVAMIPAVSMARLMWRHGESNPARRRAASAGITEELLEDAFRVHAPTTRAPTIARDHLFVVAGRGDRITPPEQAEALAAHWGVDIEWFDGGHLAQVGRGDALRKVRRALGALGLPGRTFKARTPRWTPAHEVARRRARLRPAAVRRRDGLAPVRARRPAHAQLRRARPQPARADRHRAPRLRRRRRGHHRDQHVRREPDRARAPRPRRPSHRDQPRRRRACASRRPASARIAVGGAVGPTGVKFGIATAAERRLARFALAEQIDTLVLAGVDAIVLETFTSILEMETALEVAKERGARVPAIAMMVFDAACKSDGGLGPAEIADRLIAAGADVVGGNCGIGPSELYQVVTSMVGRGKPVIAQPNAGLPASVEGRTLYVANPEHFGVFARRMLKSGVRVVGGCCGTTPEHTRAMLGAVRMMRGEKLDERVHEERRRSRSPTRSIAAAELPAAVPLAKRSRLGARIAAGERRGVGRAVGAREQPRSMDKLEAAGRRPARRRRRHRQHRGRPARVGARRSTSRCARGCPPRPRSSRSCTYARATRASSA